MIEADLTTPEGEVRKLDDLEVVGMMALISNAGNETVARLLGWAALVLDDYPDARREFAQDPSLVPTGVEELLRYEAPSPIQGRYVTRDVELHGTVIPEERNWHCLPDPLDATSVSTPIPTPTTSIVPSIVT